MRQTDRQTDATCDALGVPEEMTSSRVATMMNASCYLSVEWVVHTHTRAVNSASYPRWRHTHTFVRRRTGWTDPQRYDSMVFLPTPC